MKIKSFRKNGTLHLLDSILDNGTIARCKCGNQFEYGYELVSDDTPVTCKRCIKIEAKLADRRQRDEA